MRRIAVLVLLGLLTVVGCGSPHVDSPHRSASAVASPESTQAPTPETVRTDEETPVPQRDTIDHIPTINPKNEERADDIVLIICGIVTHEVTTHEFPQLWGEGSRETRLADEYEKLLPGADVHSALMRDCPAYARLHSKNAG